MVDKNKSVDDITPELTADEKALKEFFSDPKHAASADKMRGIIKHVLGEIANEENDSKPDGGGFMGGMFGDLFKDKK